MGERLITAPASSVNSLASRALPGRSKRRYRSPIPRKAWFGMSAWLNAMRASWLSISTGAPESANS